MTNNFKAPQTKRCYSCLNKWPIDWFTTSEELAQEVGEVCRICATNTKRCTECLEFFPATGMWFYKNKKGVQGLYASCKKCRDERVKRWKAAREAEQE